MAYLCLALGLVLLVEGILWALAPRMIEQMLEALKTLPEAARRQVGMICAVSGLALLVLARSLGI